MAAASTSLKKLGGVASEHAKPTLRWRHSGARPAIGPLGEGRTKMGAALRCDRSEADVLFNMSRYLHGSVDFTPRMSV